MSDMAQEQQQTERERERKRERERGGRALPRRRKVVIFIEAARTSVGRGKQQQQ
jgi:hypothetical protein